MNPILTFVCTLLLVCPAIADSKPPNVLFIAVDDLNDWIGCLGGHPQAKTPNIDRLASRGVLFEQAYCSAPLCNPSRMATMTGLRASTIDIWNNEGRYGKTEGFSWFRDKPELKDWVTIPQYFRQHGYTAETGGKIFHQPHGKFSDPVSWNHQYSTKHGTPMPKGERLLHGMSDQMAQEYYQDWADWQPLDIPDSETADWKTAESAAAFLQRGHDKPFFLGCGIFRPHLRWYAPQKYFDMHPLEDIELPATLENDLDDIPPIARRQASGGAQAFGVIREHDEWKKAVQGYLASCSFADACVGVVLDALEASDHAKNTIVVLCGDHGFHLGEKDRISKLTLWEQGSKTPLIISTPDLAETGGKRCSQPVSLVDLYPTLVELSGLPERDGLDGRSIAPLLRDPETEWAYPALISLRNDHAVRSRDWHYIRYSDGSEELYDAARDPHQWNNLADDPRFADTKTHLKKWLPQKSQKPEQKPQGPKATLVWPSVEALVDTSCIECHDSNTKTALNFDDLSFDLTDADAFRLWENVYDKIDSGEMPPKKKPRPNPKLKNDALGSLHQHLRRTSLAQQKQNGRTPARRLTRVEYEHTLHDLLGIGGALAAKLPPKNLSAPFDTIAAEQGISSVHIRGYLIAADAAIDEALELGKKPNMEPRHVDYRNNSYSSMWFSRELRRGGGTVLRTDDAYVLFDHRPQRSPHTNQSNHMGIHFPVAGRYRIVADAYAYQAKTPVTLCIYRASDQTGNKELIGSWQLDPGQPLQVEVEHYFQPGDFFFLAPSDLDVTPNGRSVFVVGARDYKGEGVAVRHLILEGPLEKQWPPERTQNLLGDAEFRTERDGRYTVILSDEPLARISDVVSRLGPKALRRPLRDGEPAEWAALGKPVLAEGRGFEEALRVVLRALFSSPEFLYHQAEPGPLDDYALATRLSYFLWKSLPDDQLFLLASEGALSDPAVLASEVDRLLDDEKSLRFVEDFLDQWLELEDIDATTPDERLYPEYDDLLRQAMLEETRRFFAELIWDDRGVRELIDSDFTFLNRRLAEHYDIPGIDGLEYQKVALPEGSPRGGLLAQASLLKITANGTNTSPVPRGSFILSQLLGTPPNPPPPGAGSVEPDTRGTTTIREELDAHRNVASCNRCHVHIDPPGFALESFDPIGGYRTRYRSTGEGDKPTERLFGRPIWEYRLGQPVDASGITPDGTAFDGIEGYKQWLMQQQDQIARHFVSQLIAYSTGAQIQFADRPELETMLKESRDYSYGIRSLIHTVVQSDLFRNK